MKSTIEWTDRVWNFLTGCSRISQGCKFCYMFILALRLKAMGQEKYRNGAKLTVHEHEIANPYTWKKPSMVFVNSMSDIFHVDVPDSIIIAAWKVMNETPQHTYQVLTKRPERLFEIQDKLTWTSNIWMGVSVENDHVLHRVDTLRASKALVKWISAEPLIGALSNLNLEGINWLVAGGESGISKNIRPIKKEWVLEIMNKCRENNVPFFFKQWGKKTFNPNQEDPTIHKKHPQHAKGGCQLEGQVFREFPKTNDEQLTNKNQIIMKPNNKKSDEVKIVATLSPFKKLIGEALLRGEDPKSLTIRLAEERPMPHKTAQAYVTMVRKLLDKSPLYAVSKSEKTELVSTLSPFKKLIGEALLNGENPEHLTIRLAQERPMPRKTAQAYVTMVRKFLESNTKKVEPKIESENTNINVFENDSISMPEIKIISKNGDVKEKESDEDKNLDPKFCNNYEKREDFKFKAMIEGYEYFIHCFSMEDDEKMVGWFCKGKDSLADMCLFLSEDYVIYVEKIDMNTHFELN